MIYQEITLVKRDQSILHFKSKGNIGGVACLDGMIRIDHEADGKDRNTFFPVDAVKHIEVKWCNDENY